MKVIQHNLDQKVPVYVYNLYKNLDNESKLLTKKLIEEANSSEGGGSGSNSNQKTIDDVLKGMDAKTYCQAFANDANLIGDADCENSIKNIETSKSENKSLTYNCQRTYKFNVYSNGKYNETFTPSYDANLPQCKDNQNFDDNTISCNAKPTQKIADLMLNNTQNNYTYTCSNKSKTADNNETKPDVAAFSIDTKQNIQKSLKTTNNVHLNFVTLKPGNNKYSITYNLAANVTQDAICPAISRAQINSCSYNNSITKECGNNKEGTNKKNCLIYISKNTKAIEDDKYSCYQKIKVYAGIELQSQHAGTSYADACNTKNKNWNKNYSCKNSYDRTATQYSPKISDSSCSANINYANKIINYSSSEQTDDNIKSLYAKSQQYKYFNKYYYYHTIIKAKINSFLNTKNYQNYYNKWNTFFNTQENGKYIFSKATKAAISSQTKKEGVVTNTLDKNSSTNNYLAHFIYAAIDTSFEKGEMGKNIFVFEQFGSKIIPVGYLANNQNTPLKFDVITRNPETFKIEKVNYKNGMEKRPLTFCEAMKYTGEKFSQYCGCKDANGKIVTQYTKIATCDNKFGCIIRPVQPSSGK